MSKKYALLIGLSLLVLGGLASTNYLLDYQHHFNAQTFIQEPTHYLLNGANVANLKHYDERLMMRALITNNETPSEVLAFGSERLLAINQGRFPSQTFFNYSVPHATLPDYLAFIHLLDKHEQLPKKLILGIEPNLLNANIQQTDWHSLSTEYQAMIQQLGTPALCEVPHKKSFSNYLYLFSPYYFLANIQHHQESKYYATDQTFIKDPVKCTDGSLVLGEEQREVNRARLEKKLQAFINDRLPALKQSTQPNLAYRKCFKKLLTYLREKEVEVTFFFPPYHHKVYHQIASNSTFKAIHDTEQYYKSVAIANGIEVIGSYNPTSLKLKHLDFYDSQYIFRTAVNKIFRNTEDPIYSFKTK